MPCSPSKSRQGRRCLFCDAAADSNEHVWPSWLLKTLRRPSPSDILREHNGERTRWGGANPAVRVRAVCGACNHGWMSGLETISRPVVGALVQDLAIPLTPAQQQVAAVWAVKTSMVAEGLRALADDSSFYSQTEREEFRRSRMIPVGTTVWIGRYSGTMYASLVCSDGVRHARKEQLASTLSAGCLAFQVLTVRLRQEHATAAGLRLPQRPGPWDDATLQIFPNSERRVNWPPRLSFDDGSGLTMGHWNGRWDAT